MVLESFDRNWSRTLFGVSDRIGFSKAETAVAVEPEDENVAELRQTNGVESAAVNLSSGQGVFDAVSDVVVGSVAE